MNKLLPILLVVVLSGCSSDESHRYSDVCEAKGGAKGSGAGIYYPNYERKKIEFSTGGYGESFTVNGFNKTDVVVRDGYAIGLEKNNNNNSVGRWTYNRVNKSLSFEIIKNDQTTFLKLYYCIQPMTDGRYD